MVMVIIIVVYIDVAATDLFPAIGRIQRIRLLHHAEIGQIHTVFVLGIYLAKGVGGDGLQHPSAFIFQTLGRGLVKQPENGGQHPHDDDGDDEDKFQAKTFDHSYTSRW